MPRTRTRLGRPLGRLPHVWLALFTLVATMTAISASPAHADPNPVVTENQQPGTSQWRITKPGDDVKQQVKGYASATSVNLGDTVTFFVSVKPVQTYSIDVYRIGYYQGLGGRLMLHVDPRQGVTQPTCPTDATTGMIACNWSSSYQLTVPTSWTSGIFLAKLTNAAGFQNYVIFAVRDDGRQSALLYQESVTTHQAYNNYPDDAPSGSQVPATGKSLYDYNSSTTQTGLGTQRAVKVSFDRPYADGDGAGDFLWWELYFVRWIEENGYDVSYSTDIDTDLNGAALRNHHGFLSVGHDEYWSKAMFDAAVAARDNGVNLGFFGGNSVYWQVRFESSDRVMVCYKDATLDPVTDSTTTMRWRDPQVNRPEQQLMGAMSTGLQPDAAPPASYVVTNSSNWVYAGTGVNNGDRIPSVVGYEADRYVNGVPPPTVAANTYTMLSSSPYTTTNNTTDYQQSAVYQAPSGAWVFDAGSIDWSLGLYNDEDSSTADPRIQQMTANVLGRLAAGSLPLPAAASNLVAAPSSSSIDLTWTNNATDATSYVLDRSSTPTFDTITSTTLPATATSYSDPGLGAGVYYYRLRAVNANGSSPYVTASAATVSYTALVNARGSLLANWRLGETGGTTAWDTTGANNGSYAGGPTLGAEGAIANDPDKAAGFNGSTSKVTLPSLATVGDFTVEGWSYLTSSANVNSTVYGGSTTVRILARPGAPNSATAAYASVWLNGTEYVLQPNGSSSNVNAWVHWALTRQGNTLTLYRNGTQLGQRTDLPASATATLNGNIGLQLGGGAYPMNGRIDEVALYNEGLSAADVANDYAAGLNGITPPPPPAPTTSYRSTVLGQSGLVSYWRLGESSGTTASDSKGTNNGTYVNGVTLGTAGAIANDPDTAATFSGTNQRVSLPSLPAGVTNFTVEGWTYLTNAASTNNTLYGSNGTVRLLARPGTPSAPSAAYAGVWLNGTEYTLQPNSPASNVNAWVHWVLTRQGNVLTLYRNGAQIGQRTDLPATATANVSGYIGAQGGSAYFLAGGIDDVAVYNSALSAVSVTNHYKAALYGPPPQ